MVRTAAEGEVLTITMITAVTQLDGESFNDKITKFCSLTHTHTHTCLNLVVEQFLCCSLYLTV